MLKKNVIKIKLYCYVILYLKNCIVIIKNKLKLEEIKIIRGNIVLIEKKYRSCCGNWIYGWYWIIWYYYFIRWIIK